MPEINNMKFTFNETSIFNEMADLGHTFIINNVLGRGPLGREMNLVSESGMDGARFIDSQLPTREIEVIYTIVSKNLIAHRKAEADLSGLLFSLNPEKLSFNDQNGYYEAVVSDITVDSQDRYVSTGTILFTCLQPFRYTGTVEVQASRQLDAETNYYVEPVISFTSEATEKITIVVNGYELVIEKEIPAGAEIVIDSVNQEIRQDGELVVLEASGYFPALFKTNTLSIPNISSATIRYEGRYST